MRGGEARGIRALDGVGPLRSVVKSGCGSWGKYGGRSENKFCCSFGQDMSFRSNMSFA